MIAFPVPNLAEAIWKLKYARAQWDDDLHDEWWEPVMADLKRLAEGLA